MLVVGEKGNSQLYLMLNIQKSISGAYMLAREFCR